MSFINDIDTEDKVSIAFQTRTESKDASNNRVVTWPANFTADCLFWTGSVAESLVSERFRARVEGLIIVDYDDYSAVKDNDRVKIGTTYYSVIHAENIANQNEVIQIPVEKYN